ncbi:hypothetical protein ACRBEV_33285 (plasmid) [Methylobacterium phyllosphaerae]
MPTMLPRRAGPERRLSWPETVRFFCLIARVRWLDRRLHATYRQVDRLGFDVAGAQLLDVAYRWLVVHQRIGALLGLPEPSHVAQVRAMLLKPEDQAETTGGLTRF